MTRKWSDRQRRNRSRRHGVTIVLVALAMTVLLGFCAMAVDYGFLTNNANQLQRACDAAALAGASYLKKTGNDSTDTTNAATAAVYVAFQNGVTITSANCTFLSDNTQIKVTASRNQAFMFGRALGMAGSAVTRAATAGVQGITGMTTGGNGNAVPLGITQETDNAYKNDQVHDITITLIRANKQAFQRDTTDPYEPDPFVAFDLGGGNAKSPAHMQWQTDGSEVVPTNVGDNETTLNADGNASQTIHLGRGLDDRFAQAALPPWNDPNGTMADQIVAGTARGDNPRIVSVIVTRSNPDFRGGTTQLPILDFQPVYLEGWTQTTVNGPDGPAVVTQIKVRFLGPQTKSSGQFTTTPPGTPLTQVRVLALQG